ncbi:MAG: hypothetical protein LBV52_04320 [Spirochaetaceae bacterium]|nr:hypothetical protein [Spirochaetaceae bacterium]
MLGFLLIDRIKFFLAYNAAFIKPYIVLIYGLITSLSKTFIMTPYNNSN